MIFLPLFFALSPKKAKDSCLLITGVIPASLVILSEVEGSIQH